VKKGYRVLDTNVVFKTLEIDIVAFDERHKEVVFVEVKTRRSTQFGQPASAVDGRKLRALRHAARQYLFRTGLRNLYRFDIISVTPQGVEHFENVTWP
jgi:putative endonuclease